MRKRFLWAGVLNIACAVLSILAFVGIFVMLGVDSYGDAEAVFGLMLVSMYVFLLFSYYWEALTLFPVLTILTGVEFLSKHKKGAGTKILIVINIIIKLFSFLFDVSLGASMCLSADPLALIYGAFLILVGLMHLVSVIVDIYAWPRKTAKKYHRY